MDGQANPHILAAMTAYLDGINTFIEEGELPLEYRLINAKPEPFDVHDMCCATGFMAYSFAIPKTEPILDWMHHQLDSALVADLAWGQTGFQHIPSDLGAKDISGLASAVHGLDEVRPVPQWLGSNAWVLSGDRTASGEVLFCNDAHMAYASPSVWYEAHVVTPDFEYYGNHIGGIPFPVIKRDHAWGTTMFGNDEIDLYRDVGRRHLPARRGVASTGSGSRPSRWPANPTWSSRCVDAPWVCWRTAWRCGGRSPSTPKTASTRRFTGSLDSLGPRGVRRPR